MKFYVMLHFFFNLEKKFFKHPGSMNLSLLDEHQAIFLRERVLSQSTKSIVCCQNENKNN